MLVSLLSFAHNGACADTQYSLPANTLKVIKITSPTDITVTAYSGQTLLFKQNGPSEFFVEEIIVLGPYKSAQQITLSVAPYLQQEEKEQNIVSSEFAYNSQQELDKLTLLHQASLNWNENTNGTIEAALQGVSPESNVDRLLNAFQMHLSLQNNNLAGANKLLKYLKTNSSIFANCKLIRLAKQTKNTALVTNAAARLAGLLADKNRNDVATSSTEQFARFDHFFAQYCIPIIDNLVSRPTTNSKDPNYLITQSERLLNYALVVSKKTNEHAGLISSYHARWFLHNTLNEHSAAEQIAKIAIAQLEKTQDNEPDLVLSYQMISTSLMRQGHLALALSYIRKGLLLDQSKLSEGQRSNILFSLGFLYRDLGELDTAKRYFEQSKALEEIIEGKVDVSQTPCLNVKGERVEVGKVMAQLGIIERKLGNPKQSLLLLKCATDIISKGRDYYELVLQLELARTLIITGEHEQPEKLAKAILSTNGLQEAQQLDALIILCQALFKKGAALTNIELFINKIAKLLGYGDFYDPKLLNQDINIYPIQQIETFRLLIQLSSMKNQSKWVDAFAKKAFSIIDKNQLGTANPQALNEAKYNLIEDIVTMILSSEKPVSMKIKNRIFALFESHYSMNPTTEQNRYATSIQRDDSKLQAAYKQWIDAEWSLVQTEQPINHKAIQAADIARDLFLNFRGTKVVQAKSSPTITDINALQALISEDDLLLRFFISERNSFVFIIDKYRSEIRPIPKQSELTPIIDAYVKSVRTGDQYQGYLPQLEKLLPVEGLLSTRHKKLIIVPDSSLHRLPFSSLISSSAQLPNIPIGGQLEVVRTYSFSQYFSGTDVMEKTHDSPLISIFASPSISLEVKESAKNIGNTNGSYSKFRSNFTPLPASIEEAETIQSLFSQNRLNVATGENATKDFLVSPMTRNSQVIHIATHGYFDPDNPHVVGLIASSVNNEPASVFLSLNELLSQSYSTKLVIASGCDTMLGEFNNGGGLRSLTRGFLAQGVGSTIGTLWPVQDRATSQFMRLFYTHLKRNGGDSAKALQDAKQTSLSQGRYRHPMHWAGFVLTSSNQLSETIKFL